MARIAGINLPLNKNVEYSLPYLYGIGHSLSCKILALTKIDPFKKIKELTEKEINLLREVIEKNYKIEGSLRKEVLFNIKRLKEIKCYRGTRHIKNLPTRGQRTKTNTRTVRGNKRSVAIGTARKKAVEKT